MSTNQFLVRCSHCGHYFESWNKDWGQLVECIHCGTVSKAMRLPIQQVNEDRNFEDRLERLLQAADRQINRSASRTIRQTSSK